MRFDKLFVPQFLQTRTIKLAHEGHQGIVETKSLLRQKLLFSGINRQVESTQVVFRVKSQQKRNN